MDDDEQVSCKESDGEGVRAKNIACQLEAEYLSAGETDLVRFLFLRHCIRQPPMKLGANFSFCMVQPMPSKQTKPKPCRRSARRLAGGVRAPTLLLLGVSAFCVGEVASTKASCLPQESPARSVIRTLVIKVWLSASHFYAETTVFGLDLWDTVLDTWQR